MTTYNDDYSIEVTIRKGGNTKVFHSQVALAMGAPERVIKRNFEEMLRWVITTATNHLFPDPNNPSPHDINQNAYLSERQEFFGR